MSSNGKIKNYLSLTLVVHCLVSVVGSCALLDYLFGFGFGAALAWGLIFVGSPFSYLALRSFKGAL